MSETRLCALNDIPADGTNGFIAEIGGQPKAVFAVRKGEQVFVYDGSWTEWGSSDAPLETGRAAVCAPKP